MKTVSKVGNWMSKWFTLLVILWAAVNYFLPQASLWMHQTLPIYWGLSCLEWG